MCGNPRPCFRQALVGPHRSWCQYPLARLTCGARPTHQHKQRRQLLRLLGRLAALPPPLLLRLLRPLLLLLLLGQSPRQV